MSGDIIVQNHNSVFYAYHKGRFWRWDDARNVWKESHLMAAKFERARAALKTLTPEVFFSDGAEFALLDEYEIPLDMAEALKNAKPCKNAPIDPVEESPTSSAQCSGAATAAESQTAASPAVPAASTPMTETAVAAPNSAALNSADESAPAPSNISPSFDYSGLPAQTVDTLHMAENQYAQGKKMTETGLRWMVNAVSMAHDALCSTVVQQLDNGQFAPKEDTFRAWCASISLSKSSAYNLLRVAERFGSIEIDGKSILDVQPATLLYEAAKPSAPAELVQKVTTGQITSSAEYRAVLKENQQLRTDRVNAMNQAEREKQRADAAVSEIGERDKTIKSLIDRSEEADARADNMESKYKAALADVQGLTDFEADKYNVLCNSMLLTEGWDCPSVDCVVVLRPTKVRSLYSQMVGRGTRLSPGKTDLLLLDFLWMTDKHELCRPADLVCEDRTVARQMTENLAQTGCPEDIEEAAVQASEDVVAQREEALAKQLEEQRRKKAKLVDPLQYEMSIQAEDLAGYVPAFGWEAGPPSAEQSAALEKMGILPDAVESAGKASLLLDRLNKRRAEGLTTPKQIRVLERYGFQSVGTWSFDAAKHMIDRIAAQGWRGVPKGVNPKTYTPPAEPPAAPDSPFNFGW